MPNPSPAAQILGLLKRYYKMWMIPTIVCTVAAIGYALFAPKEYSSRQTLVLRDDLVGSSFKPGRFDSLDTMKSVQETILEISRRPQVIRAALQKIGPPTRRARRNWPSEETIEQTQAKIQITAPNGAEFGRTEAIVLSVEASSRERSRQFIDALLEQIEIVLRKLRTEQFESMRMELNQAAQVAESTYLQAAEKLREFEVSVGSDLSTLISMIDGQFGVNNIVNEISSLNVEQRKALADLDDVEKQIQILGGISNNPEGLLEVPTELLQLQPTLASLAQGLNRAILQYSTSKGRYQSSHPRVREDFVAVEETKSQIKVKLAQALTSLQHQQELRTQKYRRLTSQIAAKEKRLAELSNIRVDYSTRREDVNKKRDINGTAQANLAEIQSLGDAAKEVNLISHVDSPQTDVNPVGLSKKMIVLGGMISGLMIGLGLILFFAPFDETMLFARPSTDVAAAADAPGRPQTVESPDFQVLPVAVPAKKAPAMFEPQPLPQLQITRKPSANEPTKPQSDWESPVPNAPRRVQLDIKPPSPLIPSAGPVEQVQERSRKPVRQIQPTPRKSATDTIIGSAKLDAQTAAGTEAPLTSPIGATNLILTGKIPQVSPVSASARTKPIHQTPEIKPGTETDRVSPTAAAVTSPPQVSGRLPLASAAAGEPKSANPTDSRAGKISPGEFTIQPATLPKSSRDEQIPAAGMGTWDLQKLIVGSCESTDNGRETQQSGSKIPAIRVPDVNTMATPGYPAAGRNSFEPSDLHNEPGFDPGRTECEPALKPNKTAIQPAFESIVDNRSLQLDNLRDLAIASVSENPLRQSHPIAASISGPIDEIGAQTVDDEAWTHIDLSKLLSSSATKLPLPEKLHQLEQHEQPGRRSLPSGEGSIKEAGAASAVPVSACLPLDTSITNSPTAQACGHESDPKNGTKPDNRATANTVDLRQLKDQLAGKSAAKTPPRQKKLTEVLTPPRFEQQNPEPLKLDRDIASLANSIRKMCQRNPVDGTDLD